MVRSIRVRLVMGTMLLTLLTVSAVGVVALLIMQRYMVQQERAYLTANAEAIAQQAVTFMTPVQAAPPLQQLAQTAAFLGDVTVRIVDTAQAPLADSAVATPYSATHSMAASPIYFRVSPPAVAVEAPPDAAQNVIWTLSARDFTVQTSASISSKPPFLIQEANVIAVQKEPSIWGDRLTFAPDALPMMLPLPPPISESNLGAMGAPFVYQAQGVAMSAPAQMGQVGDGVAASADVWQVEAESVGEKPLAVVSTVRAERSFLQTVGFQAADIVTAPIESNGRVIGFVELGRATDLVDEPLGAIRRALGIAAGASALLAIAVGLVMSRTLTSPIQSLAQAAAAMSNGDLTARAPVIGRDELAALARQFNQMADARHRSFVEVAAERDALRRFVADASHELRTPITALRTFNELLQGPAQADRRAQAEFLGESQAQIARLEWITRNLLDLSRWDGGVATLARAEVEMGEMVARVTAPFGAVAQERRITLTVNLPERPVMAKADETRLSMAVGNLLDNALKFTPCGGKVEVGVRQEGEGVELWVADTGMGIAADELPHIFARFYRSPRATQSGSGLGLAIVERIVHAHGATMQVESVEGVGSCFTVSFGAWTSAKVACPEA